MNLIDTSAALGLALLSLGLAAAGLLRGEHRTRAGGPISKPTGELAIDTRSSGPRVKSRGVEEQRRAKPRRQPARIERPSVCDQALIDAGLISAPRGDEGGSGQNVE